MSKDLFFNIRSDFASDISENLEVFAIMKKEIFIEIPQELREKFKHWEIREENEFDKHKDDLLYLKLKSAEKNAKKKVQDYLFNKRH